MIRYLRQWYAHRKLWRAQKALARDVEQRREANKHYLKHREAGKLGWIRRSGEVA